MGGDFEDRVAADLKEIRSSLARIDVTLARQAQSLEEHMRRTEAAEKAIVIQASEIIPLRQHVALWGTLGKILATLIGLGGVALSAFKLFGK